MTRPRQAQGRPGTPVIPAAWAAGQAPVAAKTQTAAVQLRHPGTRQVWDDALEQNVETANLPYFDGLARIQVLATQARPVITVGDREVIAQYLVTVPAGTAVAELDLVDVVDSGDPALDGRALLVAQVGRGSLLIERALFCTLDT